MIILYEQEIIFLFNKKMTLVILSLCTFMILIFNINFFSILMHIFIFYYQNKYKNYFHFL